MLLHRGNRTQDGAPTGTGVVKSGSCRCFFPYDGWGYDERDLMSPEARRRVDEKRKQKQQHGG